MDSTDVIIVGAGPSGLALAIALSDQKIKSVLLEKNNEICEDPRAIAVSGDASRIINLLGVNAIKMEKIGQTMTGIHFHQNVFSSKPFASIDHERDWLEQAQAPGTVLLQPELEKDLRDSVQASKYSELRLGSKVIGIREVPDGIQASYRRNDGKVLEIQGKYLVGADGKRGYVRKECLEAKGIQQLPGLYSSLSDFCSIYTHKLTAISRYTYEATWIAANLRIALPTPVSHPAFPLWKLGYQPEQLWDIFWPGGFHFCTHPTMPVAAGRFGPRHEKFWRFEYELPSGFLPDDCIKHLEEQMTPHLTIQGELLSTDTLGSRKGMILREPVIFPWDCVEILRCAPANFSQKVVNRWFHGNVSVIGDAAHVFPPFGAQGIACGLRDALAHRDYLLEGWSRERRRGVDDSSMLTARTGNILLSKSRFLVQLLRIASGGLDLVPAFRDRLLTSVFDDRDGYRGVDGGFFLERRGGGLKTAQVGVRATDRLSQLSDEVFWGQGGLLTLLLLCKPSGEEASVLESALKEANLPPWLLSEHILEFCADEELGNMKSTWGFRTKKLCHGTAEDMVRTMGQPLLPHYNPASFRARFGATTRYALIRPDLITFSQAESPEQLRSQLRSAFTMLNCE
ncbi:FAD NAD(P)-binding domain-containing protein [Fusarium pseudocircinatum]|uniref:FAD NAD(P)-binding domain-containing protein n=1 Tax=Fusarium pseudocircinatum TaxID=56676 RepID=A0A8H5LDY9_9HYPO|nr:FAD NAD(P)-binding domain-containing protein [Fusarium pseudocircinatum]